MAVIIKKENNKAVYNTVNVSEQERTRAHKLDKKLSEIVPRIEKEWEEKRMKKGSGRKIDIKVVCKIGEALASIVDNKSLVSPKERRWVWKAIRDIYLKKAIISKRGETRDDLEYFYQVAKYPRSFLKSIPFDSFRRLLDSPAIQQDERFVLWLQSKTRQSPIIKRGFIRKFTKSLYSLIKDIDTSVLSDQELFDVYDKAWDLSMC